MLYLIIFLNWMDSIFLCLYYFAHRDFHGAEYEINIFVIWCGWSHHLDAAWSFWVFWLSSLSIFNHLWSIHDVQWLSSNLSIPQNGLYMLARQTCTLQLALQIVGLKIDQWFSWGLAVCRLPKFAFIIHFCCFNRELRRLKKIYRLFSIVYQICLSIASLAMVCR